MRQKSLTLHKISGFTVLEILMGFGIIAIIATSIMQFFGDSSKSLSLVEARSYISSIRSEITRILADPKACRNTLFPVESQDFSIPVAITNIMDLTQDPAPPYENGKIVYTTIAGDSKNLLHDGKFKLNSITLVDYLPPSVNGNPARFYLSIEIENSGFTAGANPKFTFRIPGAVEYDWLNGDKLNPLACYVSVKSQYLEKTGGTLAGPLSIEYDPSPSPTPAPPNFDRGLFVENSYMETSAFYLSSDKNMKTDIQDISNPLKIVLGSKGREFFWKGSKQKDWGFIAQELEEKPDSDFGDLGGFVKTSAISRGKFVSYLSFMAPQVETVKQMKKIQSINRASIERLKKRILKLKKRKLN